MLLMDLEICVALCFTFSDIYAMIVQTQSVLVG